MYISIMAALLVVLVQNGPEYYQQALVQEQAAGNLEAAIRLYQDAARYAGNDRALAARAMLAAARCYEKLGQARARSLYEDIARTYADQPEEAAQARDRAKALQPRENGALQSYYNAVGENLNAKNVWQVAPGMYWTTGRWDPAKPITITGKVTQVHFQNPSISIMVEVNSPSGTVTYTVKGGAPNTLVRTGVTPATFNTGETVTVEGLRSTDKDSRLIGAATVTMSDGRRIPLGQSVSGQ